MRTPIKSYKFRGETLLPEVDGFEVVYRSESYIFHVKRWGDRNGSPYNEYVFEVVGKVCCDVPQHIPECDALEWVDEYLTRRGVRNQIKDER